MYYSQQRPAGQTPYAIPQFQPQQTYPGVRPQPQPHPAAGVQPNPAYWMPNQAYTQSPYQSPHHSPPPAYATQTMPPGATYAGAPPPKPSARTHRASFAHPQAAQPMWESYQYTNTPPRPQHAHTHPYPSANTTPTSTPGVVPGVVPGPIPSTGSGQIPTGQIPTGQIPTGIPPMGAQYHVPPQARGRRNSSYEQTGYAGPRPSFVDPNSHRPRQPETPPEPEKFPKATEADLLRAKIPAGYSTDSWNPSEEPLIVLGSVFDPYHLGKWIFDWCMYRFQVNSRETQLAIRLWWSLINVSSNYKKAMRVKDARIDPTDARTMGEFRDSANRIWARLKSLIKDCETAMWKIAAADTPKNQAPQLGKESGVAFVDTMFGEGNRRDMTVQLLQSMSTWEFRFHANCDPIIKAARRR